MLACVIATLTDVGWACVVATLTNVSLPCVVAMQPALAVVVTVIHHGSLFFSILIKMTRVAMMNMI